MSFKFKIWLEPPTAHKDRAYPDGEWMTFAFDLHAHAIVDAHEHANETSREAAHRAATPHPDAHIVTCKGYAHGNVITIDPAPSTCVCGVCVAAKK